MRNHRLPLLLLLPLLLSTPSLAANVTGRWSGHMTIKNGGAGSDSKSVVVFLRQSTGYLSGRIEIQDRDEYEFENGKVTGDKLSFDVLLGTVALSFELNSQGDSLDGTMQTRNNGSWTVELHRLAYPASGSTGQQHEDDLLTIERIRSEAFVHSRVMDHAFWLTDAYGPRLTGSPNYRVAADWASLQLRSYGLEGVHKEWLAGLGRGWSCDRFHMEMQQPVWSPLIAAPLAWSVGTSGRIKGQALRVTLPTLNVADVERFIAAWHGKLHGKLLFVDQPMSLALQTTAPSRRLTDTELAGMAQAAAPPARMARSSEVSKPSETESVSVVRERLLSFLSKEGVLACIYANKRINDSGTLTVTALDTGWLTQPRANIPAVMLASEHYNRIARLLARNIPVRIGLEMVTHIRKDAAAFNLLADIPGTTKRDEVVMLGAHLDSWTGGTGATDNAAGCAIAIEAMRILKTLEVKLQRTVRLALWGGEEQSGIGSAGYVRRHLAGPENSKLSAYFNLDSGGGEIRGIYLQGNEPARAGFARWLAPLEDLGAGTVSLRVEGGSDHMSFENVGVPAFPFIQDPLDYETRTHHTNMDVYDRLHAEDMKQAAVVVASIIYFVANCREMIPRKAALPQLRITEQ